MFKQTWWVSLAVVLAGLQVLMAAGFGFDSETSLTVGVRAIVITVLMALSALTFIGISQRRQHRRRGNALIAVSRVPSALAGIVMFWFPPMWLMTVAGIAVTVWAIRDSAVPAGVASS